jgi:hypothetical protein
MVVDGKMPRVRCTWRNLNGHQCGNLIAPGQVVCHVHRKVSGVSVGHSSVQGISHEEETPNRPVQV